MKIIMLKDMGGVGQRGAVVEVKDGYALNFLIPHGAAEQATADKIKAHEAHQKGELESREKQAATLKAAVESLNGARIVLKARATEKGGLFKSITASDIAQAIADQKNVRIPDEAIELPKPIKELGEHLITIQAAETAAHITLSVENS